MDKPGSSNSTGDRKTSTPNRTPSDLNLSIISNVSSIAPVSPKRLLNLRRSPSLNTLNITRNKKDKSCIAGGTRMSFAKPQKVPLRKPKEAGESMDKNKNMLLHYNEYLISCINNKLLQERVKEDKDKIDAELSAKKKLIIEKGAKLQELKEQCYQLSKIVEWNHVITQNNSNVKNVYENVQQIKSSHNDVVKIKNGLEKNSNRLTCKNIILPQDQQGQLPIVRLNEILEAGISNTSSETILSNESNEESKKMARSLSDILDCHKSIEESNASITRVMEDFKSVFVQNLSNKINNEELNND